MGEYYPEEGDNNENDQKEMNHDFQENKAAVRMPATFCFLCCRTQRVRASYCFGAPTSVCWALLHRRLLSPEAMQKTDLQKLATLKSTLSYNM